MSFIIIERNSTYKTTHKTYDVPFFEDSIHATVTHDPATVSQWISDVESIHRHRLHRLIVGLDVEWRPSFSRYQNPVATLQLCVGRRCLIYQLIHSPEIPSCLTGFFSNPNYTFVGIGIQADLEKLQEDYKLGFNAKSVDLSKLAADRYGRSELKNSGLKELARVVLEKEVAKPRRVTMSRWDNRWLTRNQIQYASVDAYVCFEVGRILNASA